MKPIYKFFSLACECKLMFFVDWRLLILQYFPGNNTTCAEVVCFMAYVGTISSQGHAGKILL